MTTKNEKLNSLLNYRFVKKIGPKLQGACTSSGTDSESSQEKIPSTSSSHSPKSNSNNTNTSLSSTSQYAGIFGSPLAKSHSMNSDHLCYTKSLSSDSEATILDSQGSSQSTILYYGQDGHPSSQSLGGSLEYNHAADSNNETPSNSKTNSLTTIPETPKSEPLSPESPIFKSKPKFGRNCIIDDSEEHQEPSSSTASSPWLSKENGIVTNGVSVNSSCFKQRRKEKLVVKEEYSPVKEDKRSTHEYEGKIEQLRQMFPSQLKTRIEMALSEADGDLERAIDLLIDGKVFSAKPKPKKRVIRMDSSDSEMDSPVRQPAKRARKILDDSVEESLDRPREEKIKYVLEMFPKKSRRDVYRALENNDWDISKASEELANDDGKQEALDDEERDFDSDDEGADSDDSMEELQQDSSTNTIVLSFFNDATREELASTPSCSKKKADLILALRPFTDYNSMVESFQDNRAIGLDVVRGCLEIIKVREVVVRLMQRCEKISKEMENVVAYLTKRQDFEEGEDNEIIKITKQPSLISDRFQLKPFQMVGLNWLRIMHAQQLNGILADEMGLGKTIQTIAFIAHLLEEGEEGPHLIIVPSSTIENWMREFHDWCPAIDVLVYYGSQEERRLNRQSIMYEGRNDFHVILTTYNMATGSVEDRVLFKKLDFHYAIFDEGHMLKNMSSLRYQNLMKINADRRLLLTGTPLQNNLLELMSLLSFVMPEIFSGKTDQLKRMFSMISKGTDDRSRSRFETERIMHAKRIMKPFVLRRLKSEVQKQLPKKSECIEYCDMIPEQQTLYEGLIAKFSAALSDDSLKDNSRGASMLMQLRKAANHPLLIRNHFNDEVLRKMAKKIAKEPSHMERGALPDLIYEDMEHMNDFDLMRLCDQYKKYIGNFKPDPSVIGESGKFRKLQELLEYHKSQGNRVLIFSQFTMLMDIMEEYLKQLHYTYLRMDGSTPVPDRQDMIDRYTKDEGIFIFMLSTRAGGLGINLIAANIVIIHDIDFNPYNDKQAEDRCHRVGQTREVQIVRMISKSTVEEGMLRCAKEKLKLEKDVTSVEDLDNDNPSDVASLLKDALSDKKV